MKIAVEGCCHGELDKIYDTVTQLEAQNGFKIDVLIICGDFQSVRNMDDLQAMAVPPKYQKLNTFYKYYSGEKVAPVLTIFVGGNHEASNYLQELPYGGWVARNIYYLGYAGIIQIGGIRIGGMSGIYKGNDYNKGHFEHPPYDEGSKRSVYHVRNLEVFRLKQVSRHLDIFVSHDWPTGIYNYGDVNALIRQKPFFKKEVEDGSLGSKPCADLLMHLKPSYWFAAHLHVKFAAYVQHASDTEDDKITKFLALDKCLPRRKFLQVLDVPHNEEEGLKIKLDPEWLRILQSTNHLLNTSPHNRFMPGPGGNARCDYTVSDSDLDKVVGLFGGDMTLPENFVETAPVFRGNPHNNPTRHRPNPLFVRVNPQTTLLCTMLEITDPNAKILGKTSEELLEESNIGLPSEKDGDDEEGIDDDEDDDDGSDSDAANTTFNPSYIDSSLDLSQSSSSFSSNISASWDKLVPSELKKGNDPVNTSTSSPGMKHVDVADDDEEFQSILLAQKSKSLPPTPHHLSSKPVESDASPLPSSPLISSSVLLTSTPLHRSATAPASSSFSPSSSTSASSITKSDLGKSDRHSVSKHPPKLSVADRLRALKAKEHQYKNSETTSGSCIERADSTSSTDTNCSSISRLTSDTSIAESCDDSSQKEACPNLSRLDTLDCQGIETRAQLEARCDSSGVSSTTTNGSSKTTSSSSCQSISPPLKRDNSDLDSTEELKVISSSSLSSSPSLGGAGGESVKKFKRRNVSLYQESQD